MTKIREHFLSGPQWAEFRQALGETPLQARDNQWSYLALLQQTTGFKKLYFPYNPTFFNDKSSSDQLRNIDHLAQQQRAFLVQIEPQGNITAEQLRQAGWTKTKAIQPELTWLLDLSAPTEVIIGQMAQNNRNIYRNYHKKGLSFSQTSQSEDIDQIIALIGQVADHNQVRLHRADYLKLQATTLLANGGMKAFVVKLDQQIVAGALVYDSPTTRYYAHAAADYQHRKLQPGVALLAELIIDAQQQGLSWFDFCGVTNSDDPHHPWYGFTRFKKSFGGQAHRYLGTWQKVYRPVSYWLYRLYQKLR